MKTPHRTLLHRRGLLLAGWSITWLGLCAGLGGAQALSAPAWLRTRWPDAQLFGQATLRFWGLDVYTATLWTHPTFNPQTPLQQELALELRYHRRLKGALIAERSITEMRRQAGFEESRAPDWQAAMTRLFPDVQADDRLFGLYYPSTNNTKLPAAVFGVNGQVRGDIPDALFARLFFGIWLAPETSEPQMRRRLLRLDEEGA